MILITKAHDEIVKKAQTKNRTKARHLLTKIKIPNSGVQKET